MWSFSSELFIKEAVDARDAAQSTYPVDLVIEAIWFHEGSLSPDDISLEPEDRF